MKYSSNNILTAKQNVTCNHSKMDLGTTIARTQESVSWQRFMSICSFGFAIHLVVPLKNMYLSVLAVLRAAGRNSARCTPGYGGKRTGQGYMISISEKTCQSFISNFFTTSSHCNWPPESIELTVRCNWPPSPGDIWFRSASSFTLLQRVHQTLTSYRQELLPACAKIGRGTLLACVTVWAFSVYSWCLTFNLLLFMR